MQSRPSEVAEGNRSITGTKATMGCENNHEGKLPGIIA